MIENLKHIEGYISGFGTQGYGIISAPDSSVVHMQFSQLKKPDGSP
jgi:hypothetical protein